MRGDFHIHTTYSDGALSVKGIVKKAEDLELDIIAITDHDCFSGSFDAYNMVDRKVKILIGLELSTYHRGESVHILGYFPSIEKAEKMNVILEEQRQNRITRAEKIRDLLLQYYGIKLDMTELRKRNSITRGTIANEMVRQNCGFTKAEIFRKILSEGCPAYIPSTNLETVDGIKMIISCGGTPILAHPVLLKKVKPEEIIALGVKGIEAIYPANKKADEKRMKKIARKYNILITAGSDFHDYNDLKHGNIGDVFLDEENINKLIEEVYGDK